MNKTYVPYLARVVENKPDIFLSMCENLDSLNLHFKTGPLTWKSNSKHLSYSDLEARKQVPLSIGLRMLNIRPLSPIW